MFSSSCLLPDLIIYHQLPVSIHRYQGQLNMSSFVQDFEEDEHHSTVVSQSSNESPNPVEHPIATSSKRRRNLPGNPGKHAYPIFILDSDTSEKFNHRVNIRFLENFQILMRRW
ncbi:hypothetical protein V6N13_107894 [Hibiscus sabdariffa]